VVVSRPVRRILLRTVARPPAAIPLGRRLPAGSSSPPGGVCVRAALPLSGLAPGGVCRAARVTPGAGALLPHRFTLTCATGRPAAIGGLFSVALSCGSPRLGVTQHRALWSPDVPRAGAPKHPARGRPADSPPPALSRSGGRAPMGIVAAHAPP